MYIGSLNKMIVMLLFYYYYYFIIIIIIENKILYILELTVGFETNLKTNSDRKHEKLFNSNYRSRKYIL